MLHLVLVFSSFLHGALLLQGRSGGFPKFPLVESCGVRAVTWTPRREARVVGGQVPPYGAIPWQVQLRRGREHQCGGALLSSRLVLTVAHCWTDGLVAVTGSYDYSRASGEQSVRVEKAIPHPEFRKYGPYSNDIALLVLSEPGIQIGPLSRPACLSQESPPAGTWCEVSGWGATDPSYPDQISPTLKAAVVPLLSLDTCRKDGIYGGRQQPILDSMVCAGKLHGGVDACGGDSGGPLVCEVNGRMELTGLVSWGDGCAKRHRPGVYTRISNYIPWIKEVADHYGVDYQ
ncbi:hypothetical protein RN001_013049 [Aquatica leii]|uniref:Peptidase S1 domain-containing protein n=1 Tax=Aquatica leii TaxID=1421715 RepID=A0AAN7SDL5_9COLE|nr:hypothetical protein RN001_013049 [Aquatica leii]